MRPFFLAIALAGFASAPAFAGDMTCADFSALDAGAQASMVAAMAGDGSGSMMAGMPADDDAAGTMMGAPASDDAAGSMMAGPPADDDAAAMASDEDAGAMMMADGGDGMMANDQMTAGLANACADHPEMLLDDAMQGMMAPQ